jgi:hypothetical protein
MDTQRQSLLVIQQSLHQAQLLVALSRLVVHFSYGLTQVTLSGEYPLLLLLLALS